MKPPPRLRLEPRSSRIAAVVFACATIATAALACSSIGDPLACGAVVASIGATGLRSVRRLSRCPLLLHVGVDRRISVTMPDGRSVGGSLHSDTSVGPWLTAIAWVPDGAPWFVPAKTLVLLPDMLPSDDFRRLRVYLRHGRTSGDPDAGGIAAR